MTPDPPRPKTTKADPLSARTVLDTETGDASTEPDPLAQGERIGNYEILEEIARGGMGVVYRARQIGLDRIVALKRVRTGAGGEELRRFRTEAEAAASLKHPNIVPVHEIGEHEGELFLTMDLVEGGDLADKIEEFSSRPREAVELFIQVVRAVDHAHRHGILHRDLKPANILLEKNGRPLVTDFGLAKRVEAPDVTQTATGVIMGTPAYMSPEQAAGDSSRLTISSDLFSLGVILYQLLAGRRPFEGSSVLTILRKVASEEPTPPRRLRPNLDRDIETICLKCLEKEPTRRYRSADELADDLERWKEGRPIQARPLGTGERLIKWSRRRPAVAGLILVSTLALVTIFAGSLTYNRQLRQALEESERQKKRVEQQQDILRDQNEAIEIQKGLAEERLEKNRRFGYALQLERVGSIRSREPSLGFRLLNDERRFPSDLRDFCWGLYHDSCKREQFRLGGHDGDVTTVAVTPDGQRLITIDEDAGIRIWDPDSGALKGRIDESHSMHMKLPKGSFLHPIWAVACSPDNRTLATGGIGGRIHLWDLETATHIALLGVKPLFVTSLVFSPNGEMLYASTAYAQEKIPGTIRAWDLASKRDRLFARGHDASIMSLALSPDGKTLYSSGWDGQVIAWNIPSGTHQPLRISGESAPIRSMALSPDGSHLSLARRHRTRPILVLPLRPPGSPPIHIPISDADKDDLIVFGRDGKHILVTSEAGIGLWSLDPVRHLETFQTWDGTDQVLGTPHSLACLREGRSIAGYSNGEAIVWQHEKAFSHPLGKPSTRMALSPNGALLASFDRNGQMTVRNRNDQVTASGKLEGWQWNAPLRPGPDGTSLLTIDREGRLHRIDLRSPGWSPYTLEGIPFERIQYTQFKLRKLRLLNFSRDGRFLVHDGEKGRIDV